MLGSGFVFSEFQTGLFWGFLSGSGVGAIAMFVACMAWAFRAMEERS